MNSLYRWLNEGLRLSVGSVTISPLLFSTQIGEGNRRHLIVSAVQNLVLTHLHAAHILIVPVHLSPFQIGMKDLS
jgi:hypothetical protein